MLEGYKLIKLSIKNGGQLYLCDQVSGRDQYGKFSARLLALVNIGQGAFYSRSIGLNMELVEESSMSVVGTYTYTPRRVFCDTDEILDCPEYLVLDYKHLTDKFQEVSFVTESKIRNSKPEILQEYSIGGLIV